MLEEKHREQYQKWDNELEFRKWKALKDCTRDGPKRIGGSWVPCDKDGEMLAHLMGDLEPPLM